jgi:transcriptional regulator with XRE-family HTH domain
MVSVAEWMDRKRIGIEELERASGVERKVLDAILQGRYTPSPRQRERVAAALGVTPAEIAWGHVTPVTHLYGHGPQFGRTP